MLNVHGMNDHKKWLEERKKGIGASDAASILGMNPYKTNIQLWEEKTGKREPEDISEKSFVKYGTKAEEHLRALFALDHPQYSVGYDRYKIFRNLDFPFIGATLDGWLYDGIRKGVLEIKTTEIMNGGQWQKWKDRIPDNYYCQCVWQLLATGFDFVILKAQIKCNFGGNLRIETKHYRIERSEVEADIKYLLDEAIKFWDCVKREIKPSLILPNL